MPSADRKKPRTPIRQRLIRKYDTAIKSSKHIKKTEKSEKNYITGYLNFSMENLIQIQQVTILYKA